MMCKPAVSVPAPRAALTARSEAEMPFICLERNQKLSVSFSFSTSFLRSVEGFVVVVSLIFTIGQGERKYGNMKKKRTAPTRRKHGKQ